MIFFHQATILTLSASGLTTISGRFSVVPAGIMAVGVGQIYFKPFFPCLTAL